MNLNRGRTVTSMPGPSIIPDRVLGAMHRSMPNIYEGEIVDVSLSVFEDLPAIARTSGKAFMAISNGHGAWEGALVNTLSPGDRVLAFDNGHFASKWCRVATQLGLEVQCVSADWRRGVDPAVVEAELAGAARLWRTITEN